MPRPRTTYTAEYKLAAVKKITDQKLSVAEVARRLDVPGDVAPRLGARRSLPAATRSSPVTANRPRPTTNCVACVRRTWRLRAERDPLKKPPRTSPTRPPDVPVHRRSRRRVARRVDVRALEVSAIRN